uniref:hypothetical protein n=1 Tax=Ruminococcus bicirculans (ex Wegman et al. 2014) TaxID=1160721 RepID=UPI0040271F11
LLRVVAVFFIARFFTAPFFGNCVALRMRGKACFNFDVSQEIRITPAYAGKRCLSVGLGACLQDHPRVCGEKLPIPLLPNITVTGE